MSPSLLFSQPVTNLVWNRCRSAPKIKMDKAAGELHLKIPKISPGGNIFERILFGRGLQDGKVYVPTQQFFNEHAQKHPNFPEESNFFEQSKRE